ncbi:MAG: hypothetical protein K0R90_111 [Oscillospiraceae bacterium]|jgi:hypothetical protein|nr:hypothetical protein [Oscillospiraceae bacterium]
MSNENKSANKEDFSQVMDFAAQENYAEAAKKIDEMEKKEKVNPALAVEQYPNGAFEAENQELSEYDEKQGIDVFYNLDEKEIIPALYLFQKRTIFKRNIIYSIILGIMFVFYLTAVITDPKYTIGIFLLGVSGVVMGFIWYLPYRHRRSTAAAIAAVKEEFKISFYEDCMIVGEDDSRYKVSYAGEKVNGIEQNDKFILTVGKERLFVVPKRCINEQQTEEIRNLLINSLHENYSDERAAN